MDSELDLGTVSELVPKLTCRRILNKGYYNKGFKFPLNNNSRGSKPELTF